MLPAANVKDSIELLQKQIELIQKRETVSREEARPLNMIRQRVTDVARLSVQELRNNVERARRPGLPVVAFFEGKEGVLPELPKRRKPRTTVDKKHKAIMAVIEGIRSELTAQPSKEISNMSGIPIEQTSAVLSQIIATEKHVHRKLRDPMQKQKGYLYWFDRTKINPRYVKPTE